ncbi:MAG: PilZ domain-containing protein [Hyphomonas sp.]
MSDPESELPRQSPRQRTLKGARIICAGALTYDVTIRDMSEGGVKLKLGSPFAVPPAFVLVILNPNTGVTEKRACETRWQRGDHVGAQFVAASPGQAVTRLAPASLRRTDNLQ